LIKQGDFYLIFEDIRRVGNAHRERVLVGNVHRERVLVGNAHRERVLVGNAHRERVLVGNAHPTRPKIFQGESIPNFIN
jgi:hypothetical protein